MTYKIGHVYCTKNSGTITKHYPGFCYKKLVENTLVDIAHNVRTNLSVTNSAGKQQSFESYVKQNFQFPNLEYNVTNYVFQSTDDLSFIDKQTPSMFMGYEELPFRNCTLIDATDTKEVELLKTSDKRFIFATSTYDDRNNSYWSFSKNPAPQITSSFYIVDDRVKCPIFLINGIKCLVENGSKSNFENIDISVDRPVTTTFTFELKFVERPGRLSSESEKQRKFLLNKLTKLNAIKKLGCEVSFKEVKNELKELYEAFDYSI
jgi:hypothetical protein